MSTRVFVTGATGYLGSAIAARLVRAGHRVSGLTRRDEGARALEALGVEPIVGSVEDSDTWIGTLKNCDVAVHTAFDPRDPAAHDQSALAAFRDAVIDGRLKRLLYMSGFWVHGGNGGDVVTEETPLEPLEVSKWRAAHEEVALDYAEQGLETVILRPGIVYGGSRGILGGWWKEAAEQKTVTYYGDGSQHWSTVHVADVAEAFLLALEHAKPGEAFLLADGAGHTCRELAEAVANVTGAEAQSWPRDQVIERLGAYGEALLTGIDVSAAKARRDLGWVPSHTSFVKEAEAMHGEWQTGLEEAVN